MLNGERAPGFYCYTLRDRIHHSTSPVLRRTVDMPTDTYSRKQWPRISQCSIQQAGNTVKQDKRDFYRMF